MTENEIGAAMRQLPRATASHHFTSDVLRALRPERRPRVVWRLAAAFAAVVVMVAGTYAASLHQRKQRLNELRAEQQQIEWELQRVKAIADERKPVVVLENGTTRVMVDVSDRRNAIQQAKLIYY